MTSFGTACPWWCRRSIQGDECEHEPEEKSRTDQRKHRQGTHENPPHRSTPALPNVWNGNAPSPTEGTIDPRRAKRVALTQSWTQPSAQEGRCASGSHAPQALNAIATSPGRSRVASARPRSCEPGNTLKRRGAPSASRASAGHAGEPARRRRALRRVHRRDALVHRWISRDDAGGRHLAPAAKKNHASFDDVAERLRGNGAPWARPLCRWGARFRPACQASSSADLGNRRACRPAGR